MPLWPAKAKMLKVTRLNANVFFVISIGLAPLKLGEGSDGSDKARVTIITDQILVTQIRQVQQISDGGLSISSRATL